MTSFGLLLEKARDRKRLSLDDIARETRLAKRYLQALESESLSKLPGGAYNRAYLRTYATFLGLDPDELMRKYEEEEASQTEAGRLSAQPDAVETIRQAAALRQPASSLASRARAFVAGNGWRVVAAVGGVALLGALGWLGTVGFLAPGQPAGSDGGLAVTTPASPLGTRDAAAVTASASSQRVNAEPARELAAESLGSDSAVPGSPPASPRLSPERDADRGVPEAFADEGEAVESRSEEPSAQTVPDSATGVVATLADAPRGVGLAAPQSGVGTDVVDRQLVGRAETFRVGTSVVFWTQIVGGSPGDSVRHVWLHNGRTIGIVALQVGGPSWRTQSRRTMAPDATGAWVVEARDSEGRVLARHEFRCES